MHSLIAEFGLQHIGHPCVGIYPCITVSVPIQVVHCSSLSHLPFTVGGHKLKGREISLQDLADGIIGELRQISSHKLQIGLSALKSIEGKLFISFALACLVSLELRYGYFLMVFIPSIQHPPSMELLCPG